MLLLKRRFRLTDIRGCVALYDADRIGGLADGAAVASVQDRSGNGNTASQATGANQPTYQTGELNGRAGVRHDGTNDLLATAAPVTTSLTFTIFAVARLTVPRTAFQWVVVNGAGNGYGIRSSNTDLRQLSYPGVASVNAGAATTNPEVWVARRDTTGDLWVNGTNVLTGLASTPSAPTTATAIGADSAAGSPAQMDWFVVGLWNRPWTARERKRAERHVGRRRYGLVMA